jgi:hypothetical protein
MIVLLFLATSLLPGFSVAQGKSPREFDSKGFCQIVEYDGLDVSRLCTGEYSYFRNAPKFAIIIGVNFRGSNHEMAFVGETDDPLYPEEGSDKLPRLIKVSTVYFGKVGVPVSHGFCLVAQTVSLEGQLVRCHALGNDGKVFQLLFYTPENIH